MALTRRVVVAAAAGASAFLAAAGPSAPALAAGEGNWPSIREALFAGRELKDGSGVIALEAPTRAADAAVVPITVKALFPQSPDRYIKSVHLVIDQNPAPVAGVFRFFPDSGEATFATRVRVNEYTNVHAVAETSDGGLHVVERFVKAAGGCSAPAQKDKEAAAARLGRMRLKPHGPPVPGEANRAQLLVSHPNYSGLQIDQLSRNWIPPDYVRSIKVAYAGRPVLEVEGDISLSEDPSVTFGFVPRGPGTMRVVVDDSSGRHFEQEFEVGAGS